MADQHGIMGRRGGGGREDNNDDNEDTHHPVHGRRKTCCSTTKSANAITSASAGTDHPDDLNGHSSPVAATSCAPCGACKFLRRKCLGSGCIFAPHFGSDQGAARFAAVHKVFGASNVSKLLLHIPFDRRQDAVVTISYEAQARLSDPVYGCVSTVLALQQQVASLQAELATVQSQLINSRLAVANALQISSSHQQQQQQQQISLMQQQPAYSNTSSASNNNQHLINMSSCSFNASNFDLLGGVGETAAPASSSHSFRALQLYQPSQEDLHDLEEGDHEESRNNNPIPGVTFDNNHQVLH